jgi:hypothetical protein
MMTITSFSPQFLVGQLEPDDADNCERLVQACAWTGERCQALVNTFPVYRLVKFLPLLSRLYSGEISYVTVHNLIVSISSQDMRILVLAAMLLSWNETQRSQESSLYMAQLMTASGQKNILSDLVESRLTKMMRSPRLIIDQEYRARKVFQRLSQWGLINEKVKELLQRIDMIGAETLFPYVHPKAAAWIFQRFARAAIDMPKPFARIYIRCDEVSARRLSVCLRAGKTTKEEGRLETKITARVLIRNGELLFDVNGFPDLYVGTIEE